MIATQNQQADVLRESAASVTKENALSQEVNSPSHNENDMAISRIKNLNTSSLLLPSRIITHHPKAGLNPLADAAGYLFSVLGKIKEMQSYKQYSKLQKELIQEINIFQEAVKNHGYNAEYIIVCRYALCATFDDIISNTMWGGQGQWDGYSLLAAFNQDILHHDKFFNILERAIKEPVLYIDLMELIYICLSMGYKGQYRSTEHNHYQLEQITNSLYKHIRLFRGSFSKTLSPFPLKTPSKPIAKIVAENATSPLFIFFVSICVTMTIFIGLGYLMDVISIEAYKNISSLKSAGINNEISKK